MLAEPVRGEAAPTSIPETFPAGTEVHPAASTDVAVIGGGPVGIYLAVLLLQRGLTVQVFERRVSRSPHSRAIGIHPPALERLAEAGIAGLLAAEGVQIRRGVARSQGKAVADIDFAAASDRFPFVLTLPQIRTEAHLEQRLMQLDPTALVRGATVTVLEAGDGSEPGMVLGGTVPSGRFTASASLVVAADGARSTIREGLGVPWRSRQLPDTYLMGDFADGTDDGSLGVLYLEPDGIVESFPLPGGIRRWVVHTDALQSAATADDLARLVAGRTGNQPDPGTNTMLSAFGVRIGQAGTLVSGRTALVGDAGHEISPIGGQGMNLGWMDASELAPIMAESLAGRDVGPQLRAWNRRRRHQATVASTQARLNMALGRPLPGPAMAARNAALARVFHLPAVERTVARRFTMQ